MSEQKKKKNLAGPTLRSVADPVSALGSFQNVEKVFTQFHIEI